MAAKPSEASHRDPIEAVLFDLGGTLFRYGGRQGGGIRLVLRAHGIDAAPERVGHAWRQATQQAGAYYGRQAFFLHRDLFRTTLSQFLGHFGQTLDENVFVAFHQRQLEGLLLHMPLRDDCRATLAALRERGLYVGLVSNIDDDYLYPLLERHGLLPLFDHCTSSEEARSCKPDPGIFHHALGKAGLATRSALFVGDSLHHDVAGAHRVGMRSARIVEPGIETPLTHGLEVLADPTYEIAALGALVGIIDDVNVR
jgi:HAD superfamily hydrolase (TIGR01509 family)